MEFDEFQSMILEEIDIKDEPNTDEQEEDEDPQPTNHISDRKLNRYGECRVYEEMEISSSDKEFQRDSYDKDNVGVEPETSFNSNQDARVESCGVYQKLKLLVDNLKNCKQREKCGICEKYIQQLQQHILLTHGNDQDAVKGNAIESDLCGSVPLPALDQINMSVKEEGINLDTRRDYDLENVNVNNPGVNVRDTDINSEIETETSSQVLKNEIRMKSQKKRSEKKISKSKPYKCETCGKGFLTFFDSTEHQMTHNIKKTNAAIARSNNVRPASHLNKYRLSAGSRKQELKHDVSKMRIPPPRIVRLNNHILTHTGEKAKHELIHTEVKSRMCNLCGKCFANPFHLTVHTLTHTGEKPFKCDVCGRCFADPSNFRRHKLTHTGEKSYKCDVCGNGFARQSNLTQHKLIHTGEKPHICDVCGKAFSLRLPLTRHKIVHTGEKPHKCDVCGKAFTLRQNLTRHIRQNREKLRKCNV